MVGVKVCDEDALERCEGEAGLGVLGRCATAAVDDIGGAIDYERRRDSGTGGIDRRTALGA
jgi:hypothetical protein